MLVRQGHADGAVRAVSAVGSSTGSAAVEVPWGCMQVAITTSHAAEIKPIAAKVAENDHFPC